MIEMELIDILFLTKDDVLAGSADGALAFAQLVGIAADWTDPRIVLLDYQHIGIATASFMREAVLGFRDYCRRSRPNLYPVVANANLKVTEELEGLLKLKGDAVVVCETAASGKVKGARVLGTLEDKQRQTLNVILKAGKSDAASLSRKHDGDTPRPTMWNNRLSALAAKGILIETANGRAKTYQPVLEALHHGH